MGFSKARVYEDDNKWAWKFAFRVLSIVLNITGIALTAWTIASARSLEYSNDEYYGPYWIDYALVPWNIITVSLLIFALPLSTAKTSKLTSTS